MTSTGAASSCPVSCRMAAGVSSPGQVQRTGANGASVSLIKRSPAAPSASSANICSSLAPTNTSRRLSQHGRRSVNFDGLLFLDSCGRGQLSAIHPRFDDGLYVNGHVGEEVVA